MKHISGTRKPLAILASSRFFWGVVILFILESLWFVFSAVYPMAFDEDFHFGIIQIYSHHWLPFLSHQPTGASAYGAVARDPSYLYHYLMSFPYRLIELFTKDQTIQVIWLRLINVALFTYALTLFRKLMLRTKASSAAVNVSILLFVLLPIVPQLAATINYDNLTMVLVALFGLTMEHSITAIKQKQLPFQQLITVAALSLLGSIVKYPFLPIAVAGAIVILALAWHSFDHDLHAIVHAFSKSYRQTARATRVILLAALFISTVLFSQRYIVDFARYGSPIPECDKVLTIDDCMSYGPFARNYIDAHNKSTSFQPHLLVFAAHWLYGIWYRLFFAVNGNVSYPWWARFQTYPPLPDPSVTAVILAMLSIVLILLYVWRIFRGDWLSLFFVLAAALYLIALFITNYISYVHTGKLVGVNGRYLLPLLLPLAAIAARAWHFLLPHYTKIKLTFACVVILLFLQGGGVLTFILGSNQYWYWPNHDVLTVNRTAQNLVKKLIPNHQPLKNLRAP